MGLNWIQLIQLHLVVDVEGIVALLLHVDFVDGEHLFALERRRVVDDFLPPRVAVTEDGAVEGKLAHVRGDLAQVPHRRVLLAAQQVALAAAAQGAVGVAARVLVDGSRDLPRRVAVHHRVVGLRLRRVVGVGDLAVALPQLHLQHLPLQLRQVVAEQKRRDGSRLRTLVCFQRHVNLPPLGVAVQA
jgi:hypothetical protein